VKRLDEVEVLVAAVAVVLIGGQASISSQSKGLRRVGSLLERVPISFHGPGLPYTVLRDAPDRPMTDRSLSHLDPFSGTRMVDVSPKEATHRRALARCKVAMKPETTAKVANNAITKGDVLAAARVAGIQAAKRTADLVPMCHPLLVGSVHVDFTIGDDYVEVEAKVEAVDRTGVEMEAMTACAIAALTVYDMCKTTDRTMSIGQLMLWEKTGGSSGVWKRDPQL
jgi:cyclic pyranopterin monophosphate synthase